MANSKPLSANKLRILSELSAWRHYVIWLQNSLTQTQPRPSQVLFWQVKCANQLFLVHLAATWMMSNPLLRVHEFDACNESQLIRTNIKEKRDPSPSKVRNVWSSQGRTRLSSKNTSYTPRFVNQTLGGCFDENCPNFKTLLQCKQNFGLGLTLAGAIARIGATNRNAWLSRNMFLSPTKGLCSKRWYPLRSVTAVINLLTSYFIYHCRFRSIPFLYQKNVPWRAD